MANTQTTIKALRILAEDLKSMGSKRSGSRISAAADTIEQLTEQLAKAKEDHKALFSAFESCQDELKKANERESVLSCHLDSHIERVAELEKENKRESMELRSRLGSALGRNSEYNSAIENMQHKLAKANERVAELENKHLNLVLWHNLDPQQAKLYSDKYANKFALEQKVEAVTLFASSANEMGQFGWSDCQWLTDYAEEWAEQLRKGGES